MSDYYAFDFDGVICDSSNESGLTAWRGAHVLWPHWVEATPDPGFVARFPALRPVIETGYENLAVVALVVRGHGDAEILDDFPRLRDRLMQADGLDAASMRAAFGAARDAWIASDEEGWLAAQGFYPGVVEAINALEGPRCIITTKEERFARVLVERAGLRVDPERIYALEAFEGGGKRSVLEKLAAEFPGHDLHFFEDRLATLLGIRDAALARLYLVDWGYNTQPERKRAGAEPAVQVLDLAGFRAVLGVA